MLVHHSSEVMGCLEWILDAYQVTVVSDSLSPVLSSLAVMMKVFSQLFCTKKKVLLDHMMNETINDGYVSKSREKDVSA